MLKSDYLNYFCATIFLIIFFFIFKKNFSLFISNWALGEWLINYEGGFVRRGLVGQILIFFDKPGLIINLFQKVIISLFFLSILIYLFLERKKSLLLQFSIIILFCSGGLFDFLTSKISFEYLDRKEILFYLVLMFLLLLKYFFPINSYYWIVSCSILSSLMILAHELFAVFFVPSLYFIIFLNCFYDKKFFFKTSFLFLTPTIIVFLLVFINNGDRDTIISIFESYRYTDVQNIYKIQTGINALAWTLNFSHSLALKMFEFGSIYPWLFYLFFNFFICIILSYSLNFDLKSFFISITILFLVFIGLFVASYSGWDWGRFISMSAIGYAILLCINFSNFKSKKNTDKNNKLIFDKLSITKFKSIRTLCIYIFVVITILSSINITMPHCCPQKSLTFIEW